MPSCSRRTSSHCSALNMEMRLLAVLQVQLFRPALDGTWQLVTSVQGEALEPS